MCPDPDNGPSGPDENQPPRRWASWVVWLGNTVVVPCLPVLLSAWLAAPQTCTGPTDTAEPVLVEHCA